MRWFSAGDDKNQPVQIWFVNGTISTVKWNDQEVRPGKNGNIVKVSLEERVFAAIRDVFRQREGETSAQASLREAKAAEKLSQQFGGKPLAIRFPVKDVREAEQGLFEIDLGSCDVAKLSSLRRFFRGQMESITLPLTEAEVSAINKTSVLVVSGKMRFEYNYNGGPAMEHKEAYTDLLFFQSPITDRRLKLVLYGITNSIENPRQAAVHPASPRESRPTTKEQENGSSIPVDPDPFK